MLRKIKYVLVTPPRWSSLRTIGNSPAVKLTLLIPLVGYFILFNNHLFKSLEMLPDLQQWVEPRTRIYLFYFALCALAIGAGIYAIFCPPEIKRFESATEYINTDMESLGSTRRGAILKIVERVSDEKKLEQLAKQKTRASGSVDRQKELRFEYMHSYFDYLNQTHIALRQVAKYMYFVGFLLLGFSAVEVFVQVLVMSFKQWFFSSL